MDVTVIIPHYNSTATLKRLIQSIPCVPNLEVIVVDDRSSIDDAENMIRNIKCKNYTYFVNNRTNKGAGVCRNIGLELAKGKWVLFADSDDYFQEKFFETISNYITTSNDVIFFPPTSLDSATKKTSNRHITYRNLLENFKGKKNISSELKLRYCFYPPWSKLIRKKFLENNHIFFDQVEASNDIMFSTKVGHYMRSFVVSDETIYTVVRTKGSLTMNTSLNVFESRLHAHIRYCNFLRTNLEKQQLKYFDLKGTGFVANIIKYRLGLKTLFKTIRLLRKSKIKILHFNMLNPIFLIKKFTYHLKKHKANKNYYCS